MNKSAVLLCSVSAVMLGLPVAAMAYDDDPGYGPERPLAWYGGDRTNRDYREYRDDGHVRRFNQPAYYVPTQRYFGNGYTVSYRYMPVYRYDSPEWTPAPKSSNFRTEAFHIETKDIPAWGAKSPRVTVKDPKTSERPAVTRIVPAKSTSRTPGKSAGAGGLAAVSSDPMPVGSPAKP